MGLGRGVQQVLLTGVNRYAQRVAGGLQHANLSACTRPTSSLSPDLQKQISSIIDSWAPKAKRGRTVQEQIDHLNRTWKRELTDGRLKSDGSPEVLFKDAELFTQKGKTGRYLRVNGELYYIPKSSAYTGPEANDLADSLYNKLLGQTRICKKGHFGRFSEPYNDMVAYKYIEADASIIDYPNLLKEGFGLDLLLSTPISAKSVIVKNGQAIRLENDLCKYIGCIGHKMNFSPKELITSEVKISEYFDPNSEAYEIIKDFTPQDIKEALKKLQKISSDELTLKGVSSIGYERVSEQLKLRKEYLEKYLEKMEQHPKKGGEMMSEYLERIEEYLPKYEKITMPVDEFLLRTQPDSFLRTVEENWQAYQRVGKQKFRNVSTDVLEEGTFIHNAGIGSIEGVLDDGLMTGQTTLRKVVAGSTAGGNSTSTPGMLDTFIIKEEQKMGTYFVKTNRHSYEWQWMDSRNSVCYTIDKNRISEFNKKFYDRSKVLDLDTHWTIPFGVPASCIDRIIVSPELSEAEISNIIKQIEKRGLDIKLYTREGKLLYEVQKVADSAKEVLQRYNWGIFGRQGIPLKYSREEFRNDVWNLIAREVPANERTAFLERFNMTAGANGVLDGVPVIEGFVPKTQAEQKMLNLVKKYYSNETAMNGVNIDKQKETINQILKEFPEFGMLVGKPQHGTHAYSVDIHSLLVLQKAMNHPAYEQLSSEGKEILRLTALMHDFGKMGGVITPGHARLSKEMAERVLNAHNISPEIKSRVLNQIEHHHWFEGYNTGYLSEKDFARIFPNKEDQAIAKILAKGDFESVNPSFHLQRMTGSQLTQQEYENAFSKKMNELSRRVSDIDFEQWILSTFKK